jgi:hypothetical protein
LSNDRPPDDPAAAAEAFAARYRVPEMPLDFSLASLPVDVDRLVQLPAFCHGRDRAATDAEERAEVGLCAYIGESLRRAFDGEWVGGFDPCVSIMNYYRSRVRFGAYHFNPHAFVGYRLANGPEEGTFKDYLKDLLPCIEARDGEPDPRF